MTCTPSRSPSDSDTRAAVPAQVLVSPASGGMINPDNSSASATTAEHTNTAWIAGASTPADRCSRSRG
jgi:hypothetical protein